VHHKEGTKWFLDEAWDWSIPRMMIDTLGSFSSG
jgi:hypothetical protein